MNNELTIEKYLTIKEIFDDLRIIAGIPDNCNKLFEPEGACSNESIVERLCSSLQNSGQMRNSIMFNEKNKENRDKIKEAVCDYDSAIFFKRYANWESLYDSFIKNGLKDNGRNRQVKKEYSNNIPLTNWEKYAKGLFEGINFLANNNGFEIVKGLIDLTSTINKITDIEINKIKTISNYIPGFGLALTCDWLKECGCTWLVKPDIHIIEVYKHLINSENDKIKNEDLIIDMFDYSILIQHEVDKSMTAYKLDKMIWLICTGDFYQYNIKIGRDLIIKRV